MLSANEINLNKLEYIFMLGSVFRWDAIQESTKTHESPSVSALEEHQRQPSLFELVYFNMKDIHGHSFPPLTVKGHRNNEVLQLLSFWACAETLERLILIESKVTTAMLSRASRDEWYVCRSTGVQSSLSLQAAMQALNHNLMSNNTIKIKKNPRHLIKLYNHSVKAL